MFVCCACCVSSGIDLCDALITRPEESYRLCCVAVCNVETSRMRRSWPALGRSAIGKKIIKENWKLILGHVNKLKKGNIDMAAKIHGQPSFHIQLKRSNKLLLQSIFLTRTVRQLWIPSASCWCARRWNRNITEQIFPRTLGNNRQIRWLLQSTGIISLKFPWCYDKHCLHQTAVLDIATLWIPVSHTKNFLTPDMLCRLRNIIRDFTK